jgi:hypothetical protein
MFTNFSTKICFTNLLESGRYDITCILALNFVTLSYLNKKNCAMKNLMKLFGFCAVLLISGIVLGQNQDDFPQKEEVCKVVGKDLKGEYYGKCKKGLAHGQGIFNFSEGGKVFDGKFKKGKMNGKGMIYVVKNGEKEVLKEGIWKNNAYVGEEKIAPFVVNRTENLDRHTVRKMSDGNKVNLNFYQNGIRNNVSGLTVFTNNGNQVSGSYIYAYENLLYPFKCEVSYTTLSKFKTTSYRVRFEIVINEPGEWDISLYN